MVISTSMQFNQNTSDNINPADATVPILKKTDEILRLEEGPTRISSDTLGHSWIVGSTTNGLVGVNTGTVDGQQQTVGGGGRVITVLRVVNPNDTFRERFGNILFKDTSEPNTSNWDIVTQRLTMHTSDNHGVPYNTIATTTTLFTNLITIVKATVHATETRWNPNDLIKYFLSADGGNNWEEVTIDVEHNFSTTGQDLRLKVIFFGNGGNDTYIENLQVNYKT